MIAQLRLKPGHEQRALSGHPWIFAGQVEAFPRGSLRPGDLVDVLTARGKRIGRGTVNPQSQILVRLLDRGTAEIDTSFFTQKIQTALDYRRRIGYEPACIRIVSSEGDGLPGLIVDRYGDRIVLQALTQGIYQRLPLIQSALVDLLHPKGIYLKNDSPILEREGLPLEKRLLWGDWPEPWEFELDGLRLSLDIQSAQKTGLFLDQTVNRRMLASYVQDKTVLDAFCYVGLWSLTAARHGAKQVQGVDCSRDAIARAVVHAEQNRLSERCRFETGNVFEALENLAAQEQRFDVVILDPPAFVKTKTCLVSALKGYEKLNRLALQVLAKPGLLVTCSCSYQVTRDAFLDTVTRAVRKTGGRSRMLHFLSQAPDHPILPHVPETQYLKCAYLWVEQDNS